MSTSIQLIKQFFFIGVLIFLSVNSLKTYAFQQKDTTLVVRGKLKNGIEFSIQENSEANETLFYFLVKTGSINETDDQLGYAHFLEHMAFNGGKRFKNDSFIEFLKSQGLQIGVNFNATTNYNYTLYEINFPKTISEETQEKILRFFADILNDLSLKEKVIKIQKKIVLAEKEAAPKIDSLFLFKLGESKYLHRLAIGTKKSILEITPLKLKAFYKKWYQPHAASLFVIGNLSARKTENLVKKTFSKIKNTNKELLSKDFFGVLKDTVVFRSIKENKKPKLIINLAEKHWAKTIKEAKAKRIITNVLSKRLDSIFTPKTSVRVRGSHFLADVYYTSIECNLTANPLEILNKVIIELKRLAIYGISKEELRKYLTKKTTLNTSTAKSNNYYATNWMDSQLSIKEEGEIDKERITNKLIKRCATQLWKLSRKRIYLEKNLETKNNITIRAVENILKSIEKKSLKDYKYKELQKNIKKEKNKYTLNTGILGPKKPVIKNKYDKLGVSELVYKNGIKVYVKPISTSTDDIHILGYANGGISSVPDSLYYRLESAISYMDLGGVGELDDKELESFLEDKNMGVSQIITEDSRVIYGFSAKKEIHHFFKYLYLKMTAARANKKEFEAIIADEIKSLSTKFDNPFTLESDFKVAELSGVYYPNRKGASILSEFKKLNIYEMKAWYDNCFSYANDWNFVITGNFDSQEIITLLDTYFGNLKRKPKPILNKQLFKIKNTDSTYIYSKQHSKIANITQVYYLPYMPSLKNNLLLSLSERMLRDKVTHLLRESLGFVYTPRVSIEKNILNNKAVLKISWKCSSKVLEVSKNKLKEVLISITKKPLNATKLEGYKQQLRLQYNTIVNSKSTYTWGFSLHKSISEHITVKELSFYEEILNSITPEEIQDFLKKTFEESRKNTVID